MAKGTGSKRVGATGNYEYTHEVNPDAEFHSIKAGVYKKFKDLTDADIEKCNAIGKVTFTKVVKAAKA